MPKYTKEWWNKAKQMQTELIGEDKLQSMLSKCTEDQERIAIILLYYTGARPRELIAIRIGGIKVEKAVIAVSIPTVKTRGKGTGRTVFIPLNQYTQVLADYVKDKNLMDMRLLYRWNNAWNIRDLVYKMSSKEFCAYFFRHNRMTLLANKGATVFELQQFKGAVSLDSVTPYIQMSGHNLRKMAKRM